MKNRLSEYLRRVSAGERVIVTDRGRPVAELAPLRDDALALGERLARLEAEGEIELPRKKPGARRRAAPVAVRGRPVSETLVEDRR